MDCLPVVSAIHHPLSQVAEGNFQDRGAVAGLQEGRLMRALTEKQRRVYEYIQDYFIRQGLPPSVREVAHALGK